MRRLYSALVPVLLVFAACGSPADTPPTGPTSREPEFEEGHIEVADGLNV